MSKILTEISAGELLDKISILEIKLNKISNPGLLNKVKKTESNKLINYASTKYPKNLLINQFKKVLDKDKKNKNVFNIT